MRVFVTGASGHNGLYVVSDLIDAGHEVLGLARSDAAAAAVSALGAKVRCGGLDDLGGLKEAAADSDGVIHVAWDRGQAQSGGLAAAVAEDLAAVHALGEALAGTGKPLVAAASIGAPGNWFRLSGFRYQHGFSTRSGNDGKQPARSGQTGHETGLIHSGADRPVFRVHDRYISRSGSRTSSPVTARPISIRWISLVPSKMVKIFTQGQSHRYTSQLG
jgi:putative NAD(P)-binding protein